MPSRLIVTGEPPYPNAKVYSLDRMLAAARHDLIVMSDSDIRVTPDMLSTHRRRSSPTPTLGMATCPYRAVPGRSFWSTLEAVGLNTEFIGGVLVARMLDGMKFALGPTIAARRETLERIGGFDAVKDYLAEDFVMGKLAAERGVRRDPFVVRDRAPHRRAELRRQPEASAAMESEHAPVASRGDTSDRCSPTRCRWRCCCGRSRPEWWPVAAATVVLRAAAGWATAGRALRDPLTSRLWWLVPVQDVASFLCWLGGFFGNTIVWRGRRYYLRVDGRFEPIEG